MDVTDPVSTGDETQNPTPELDATPEVVNPETVTPEPDETPDDPRDKTVKSLQRRVDRITAARYQAEARAQQAEREREEVRQKLAQYEAPDPPQAPQVDAMQLAELIAEVKEHQKTGIDISKKGRSEFPDFDKAISVVLDELGPLYDRSGMFTLKGKVIAECAAPAAVIHAIGTNPELAAELAELSPTKLARRLERLEDEMSKPKEPPRSNAPKPLKPVKAVSSDVALSDQDSAEAWAAKFYALRKQGKPF